MKNPKVAAAWIQAQLAIAQLNVAVLTLLAEDERFQNDDGVESPFTLSINLSDEAHALIRDDLFVATQRRE